MGAGESSHQHIGGDQLRRFSLGLLKNPRRGPLGSTHRATLPEKPTTTTSYQLPRATFVRYAANGSRKPAYAIGRATFGGTVVRDSMAAYGTTVEATSPPAREGAPDDERIEQEAEARLQRAAGIMARAAIRLAARTRAGGDDQNTN